MNDHIDEAPGNPGGQLIPDNSLTAAELRIARESLGLTLEAAAKILCVNERTFRRWEFGYTPVPEGVAEEIADWCEFADQVVDQLVARLLRDPAPVLSVLKEGEADGFPASWWRAIASRVLDEVPDARAIYGGVELETEPPD